MRTKILVGCAVIVLGCIGDIGPGTQAGAGRMITRLMPRRHSSPRIANGCHNHAQKARGFEPALRLTIDNLDTAPRRERTRKTGKRSVRKVRAGMMPPPGCRGRSREVFESDIVFLETELDRTAKRAHAASRAASHEPHRIRQRDPGSAGYRDRPEQVSALATIRRAASTTSPARLAFRPTLLEGYVSAAGKISRLAIGDVSTPVQTTYRVAGRHSIRIITSKACRSAPAAACSSSTSSRPTASTPSRSPPSAKATWATPTRSAKSPAKSWKCCWTASG